MNTLLKSEGLDPMHAHRDPEKHTFRVEKGINEGVVKQISAIKNEPDWMLNYRLSALNIFFQKPMPTWGADLSSINFDNMTYYVKPADRVGRTWDEVPQAIKETYEKIGVPQAEKAYLAGVKAQYESEVVYGSLLEELKQAGVIFLGMDQGLKEYPELVRQYFGTIIPAGDNKFSALNSAVWSGGSFIYIPKGVKVERPLQAYFRINQEQMGQFERTLIIVDEDAFVHYVEGCTAPIYATDSLHAAVVEIIVKKNARCRYTTIQNWSKNVYNLVTKRAHVYQNATMEWVDGNLGSKVTMKYPSVFLREPGARGEILSIAFAGKGQHQDAGGKAIHMAPYTSSSIISKSISKETGRASYRGLVQVIKKAHHCKSHVVCDALLLDPQARTDTYPTMKILNDEVNIEHEATVSKVGEEQLFYLMSRGLSEQEASSMIVNGFLEPIVKELPMEYAVELNRLIELEMEGSVG